MADDNVRGLADDGEGDLAFDSARGLADDSDNDVMITLMNFMKLAGLGP